MFILGISCFYHDSAACLIKNGEIIAAAQEERFSRIKHDQSFPKKSIKYCLKEANISENQISNIVFYEKPLLKFERLLETYLAYAPKGFKSFLKSMPLWIKDKLFQKSIINKELKDLFGNKIDWNKIILFSEHHLSHAASAFYPSPFENAAIITIDGVGEWATTSISEGDGKKIKLIKEIHFPHSLGLLYSAFTYYAGFKVNSGEYKLMGLAPYGKPVYVNKIKENLIKIELDGSFKLNMKYFNFTTGLTMTNKKFHNLFGGVPRKSESEITQKEMDLAASIQKITEEVVINISKYAFKETGLKNLCIAGGVALNCVANGVLLREKIFENIWIQPAAGDAGGALGAALSIWHLYYKKDRKIDKLKYDSMKGSYLGPSYTDKEIEEELKKIGAKYVMLELEDLIEKVAIDITKNKAVGWMQGRMEFGPRALGSRSILADARSPSMQKQLNLKVKFRESFRPFAPSILSNNVSEWFDHKEDSPYMLFVSDVKSNKLINNKDNSELFGIEKLNVARSEVPAITHVDNSARIQTVHKDTNEIFHKLISKFYEITKCPLIVNTSFNVRGEPIVCSPSDAFKCFMGTDLDVLVIGNFYLEKKDQNKIVENYTNEYELD